LTPYFSGISARSVTQSMRPVLLELLQQPIGNAAAGPAIPRVVDDEVELRPVLRRLADVAHVRVGTQMREALLDRGGNSPLWTQTFRQAGLHQLLVEGIHQLLVVERQGCLRQVLVGVVADRVALERIGLELSMSCRPSPASRAARA
jgi:hypothetical protein